MKRTTIHISAALALLLGLAACTQDEAGFLPEGAEGTPIVFTATLTSTDPHYWTNHDDITVTAWWPYTEGETTPPAVVVRADQSSPTDFEGSDFISAEEQTVSYGNPTLRFTHRTARVTVVLTDYTEGMASVKLTGLSTENGNPAEIAPYDKGGDTYTALVAPQSVATGTAFITCAFTNGKVFVYKMKEATDWQAGEEYTYTVSLAAAEDPGYTVSEDGKTYNVTSADGLLAWNEAVQKDMTLNCTLADNIDLTGKDWTPIGTSFGNSYTGTFDGNGKTITGLTVTGSDRYTGLFGFIKGTVKNVVLTEINITSGTFVGGVAGWSFGGNIENCSVSGGSVSGSDVGGVVGYQQGGSITGCSSSATVKGTQRAGGVAGVTNSGATLTACYATGDVTVENDGPNNACAGGVVGSNAYSTVIACYAAGNVSGTGSGTIHVGGVVGENYATVTACYWSGLPDNDNGGATKVDGTTVTWQNAVDAMNAALNGSEWHYELTGELPTLKK